jgi:hypothetical protein
MAVSSAGFKQQCPTCETMVLIKDPRQVGKKMECPKCKDRFVVEAPSEDEQDANVAAKPNGKAKAKSGGKAAPAGKPQAKKRFREDDDDDADEERRGGKHRDEDDDDAPARKKKSSSGSAGSKKMLAIILAGVGLVVLVVAAVLILMNRSPSPDTKPAVNPMANNPMGNLPGANAPDPNAEPKKDSPTNVAAPAAPVGKGLAPAGAEITNLLPNDTEHVLHVNFKDVFDVTSPYRDLIFAADAFQDQQLKRRLGFSLAAMDTLIRADRYSAGGWNYSVIHFTEAIDQKAVTAAFGLQPAAPINNQVYYQAAKSNPWFDELSRLSLGVANNQRNLGAKPERPRYVRFHNPQTLIVGDEAPIVALLKANSQFKLLTDLPPAAAPNQQMNPMYQMPPMGMPPMGMPPMGSPMQPGNTGSEGNAAGIGDEAGFGEPQTAQLAPTIIAPPLNVQSGGQGQSPMGMPPMGMPPMGMPMPGMTMPGPNQGGIVRSESWLTIDPALKALLDRLQYVSNPAKEKVYFASATDMASARLDTSRLPEFKDRVLWNPRQLWDITQLLQERKQRIKALGTVLLQRDARIFQYRTELICTQEADAKELHKELREKAAPQVVKAIDRLLLGHTVELPKVEAVPMYDPNMPPGEFNPMPMGSTPMYTPPVFNPMGGMPGTYPGDPNQPRPMQEELPKASKLNLALRGSTIDMTLDLVFDHQAFARVNNLVGLLAVTLKSEVDLAGGAFSRHDLALAVKQLGEKGLSDRGVAPGRFPPGAFKRAGGSRLAQQPYHRMSWLTGLLPYMGQDALYQKLDFDVSWQDPKNWLAARTIVPQFLDPQYPDHARFTALPDVGVEMASTHVVGIAGVGLDAAEYRRDDPAFVARRGVFGYDGSAALDEIRKGRGLSNTAVLIQVPHDGPTGVSPWIAGGGASVRGVPEKNSIAPFVLTTDRHGKPIQHNGKRGTYVTMADGSVRFVSASVSDEVFQAMCTVQGPAPANFDLFKNENTPLVPPTAKTEEKAPPPEKAPAPPPVKAVPPTNPVSSPAAGAPAAWTTFQVPGGGFSVSMPTAKPLSMDQQIPGGPKMKAYVGVDLATQNAYVAMLIPLDPKSKTEFTSDPDKMYRKFAAGMGGAVGQGLQEKPITLGALQGREFSMREPRTGKQMFMRAFVINDALAIITATSDQATPSPQAQAFLDSLKVGN